MRTVKFKPQALYDLRQFVRNYEEAFFDLFLDSGLWNEKMILESYRKITRDLYLTILKEIEVRLSHDRVLGRKEYSTHFEIDFYVKDRLVLVYLRHSSSG